MHSESDKISFEIDELGDQRYALAVQERDRGLHSAEGVSHTRKTYIPLTIILGGLLMVHVAVFFSEIQVDEVPLLCLGGQGMILVAQHLVHDAYPDYDQVDVILRILIGVLVVILGEELVELPQILLLRAHYNHQVLEGAKVFGITLFYEGLREVGLRIQVCLDQCLSQLVAGLNLRFLVHGLVPRELGFL